MHIKAYTTFNKKELPKVENIIIKDLKTELGQQIRPNLQWTGYQSCSFWTTKLATASIISLGMVSYINCTVPLNSTNNQLSGLQNQILKKEKIVKTSLTSQQLAKLVIIRWSTQIEVKQILDHKNCWLPTTQSKKLGLNPFLDHKNRVRGTNH